MHLNPPDNAASFRNPAPWLDGDKRGSGIFPNLNRTGADVPGIVSGLARAADTRRWGAREADLPRVDMPEDLSHTLAESREELLACADAEGDGGIVDASMGGEVVNLDALSSMDAGARVTLVEGGAIDHAGRYQKLLEDRADLEADLTRCTGLLNTLRRAELARKVKLIGQSIQNYAKNHPEVLEPSLKLEEVGQLSLINSEKTPLSSSDHRVASCQRLLDKRTEMETELAGLSKWNPLNMLKRAELKSKLESISRLIEKYQTVPQTYTRKNDPSVHTGTQTRGSMVEDLGARYAA